MVSFNHCGFFGYPLSGDPGEAQRTESNSLFTTFENLPVGLSDHTLGFCSTHGYYKTLEYGPDRPIWMFSKTIKTSDFPNHILGLSFFVNDLTMFSVVKLSNFERKAVIKCQKSMFSKILKNTQNGF